MKAARPYAKVTITPKGEAALTGGHPWVYEGEVTSVESGAEDGGLVDVVSAGAAGWAADSTTAAPGSGYVC